MGMHSSPNLHCRQKEREKMKKTITLLTLITVAAITLTGCDLFGKNKIDITTFEKVTTDAGLLLFGGIDENTPPTLEAHRIAMSIDQSTALAFYDCTTIEEAEKIYDDVLKRIEDRHSTKNPSKSTTTADNYIIQVYSTDDMYTYLIRVDDTVMSAYCNAEDEKALKDIIDELGY